LTLSLLYDKLPQTNAKKNISRNMPKYKARTEQAISLANYLI